MNRKCIDTRNFPWKPLWVMFFYLGTMGFSTPVLAADIPATDATRTNSASEPTLKTPKKSKTGSATKQKKIDKKSVNPTTSVDTSSIKSESQPSEPLFATVNGKPILLSEFDGVYADTIKERFYHGLIPEGQAEVVRKDVTTALIDRELLVGEAEKRGVVPSLAKFDQVLASYDARYRDEPRWKEQRDLAIPVIKNRVAGDSLVEELRKIITDVPKPTSAEVLRFYEKNPALFTEPENPRLSVILLMVDPSSTQDQWNKAQEKARAIYDRIKGGGDFAKEARLHSNHASADNGGDMGYLHGGMLSEGLENKLSKLEMGGFPPN